MVQIKYLLHHKKYKWNQKVQIIVKKKNTYKINKSLDKLKIMNLLKNSKTVFINSYKKMTYNEIRN